MGFIQGPLFFTTHAFITFICPLIFAVIVARAKPRREWNLRPELTPFQRFHKVQTFGRHYDILIFSGCRRRSVRPCTAEGQGDEQGYTDAIQMLYSMLQNSTAVRRSLFVTAFGPPSCAFKLWNGKNTCRKRRRACLLQHRYFTFAKALSAKALSI